MEGYTSSFPPDGWRKLTRRAAEVSFASFLRGVAGGVSAPRPRYAPDPKYSEEARRAKFQGSVLLALIVGRDGNPRDLRILRSVGLGSDEMSLEAVRTWRFEPARKGNVPVSVQISVEVNFRLY
jgi:protein TonB